VLRERQMRFVLWEKQKYVMLWEKQKYVVLRERQMRFVLWEKQKYVVLWEKQKYVVLWEKQKYCAAGFALLNLPKGKSLGRSKPETNSSNEQARATHCVGFLLYPSSVELPHAK
jgi:hypothetical protein